MSTTRPKSLQAQASHEERAPAPELDVDSLNAIRSLLEGQEAEVVAPDVPARLQGAAPVKPLAPQPMRRSKADDLPPLVDPVGEEEAAEDVKTRRKSRFAGSRLAFRRGAQTVQNPPGPQLNRNEQAVPTVVTSAPKAGRKARITGYRPSRRHILIGGLALLVLFKPWLVFGLTFIFLCLLTGVFLVLGYDGFWMRVMKMSRWYANRDPGRAAHLHARLDRFAMKWDAVLDRFPEGTVDGLYLPDFGELATADSRHEEVLARRLEGLRKEST